MVARYINVHIERFVLADIAVGSGEEIAGSLLKCHALLR